MDVLGRDEAVADRDHQVVAGGEGGQDGLPRLDAHQRVDDRGVVDLAAGRVEAHGSDVHPGREPFAAAMSAPSSASA
ncbi:hypothetical protein [Embleya sp. NBC_00896]|uniref:hypothetical protein n=1 Tax=Embleya sp. NBC_00896 TaxID=2975961 RepID=UPI002F90ECEC